MTGLYEITYKDEQGNMNTMYPVAGQLKRTFASSGAITKTELITVSGTTDGYKLAVEATSSDNLEVQHILLDDVSTKEVWYGNSTKMMTLQPVGSGVNITGGNLTVNGTVTASTFNGTALKATQDANGNSIVDTYATKTELSTTITDSIATSTEVDAMLEEIFK